MVDTARALTPAEIAAARHDSERSPQWARVRAAHLKLHPSCAACGRSHDPRAAEVHHRMPFHIDPSRELDPENLITLCQHEVCNCHLVFGHLLNYRSWNTTVGDDAAAYLARVLNRPMLIAAPEELAKALIDDDPDGVVVAMERD